jgi:predicted methyltransferase
MYDQSKLSELIRFARVDAGSTVIDVYPGDGDWTRLFSDIVGPEGWVYSFVPAEVPHFKNDPVGRMRTLAKEPGRENVKAVSADLVAMPEVTQPADVLWLHLFYHDLYTALIQARGATAAHFNRAAYERLKPGGSYVIVDHAAAVGAGTSDAQSLHRIEPASVREEVEAAGFVLDAESTMQGRSALDQGVRSLDQGRDRSLRLPVREALTGPGADFMSTSPWVQTSPSKTSRQPCLPPRSRLWMSSSGGPTRSWQRRPLKRHSDATGIGAEHGAAILPRSKRSGDILPLLQHAVRDG